MSETFHPVSRFSGDQSIVAETQLRLTTRELLLHGTLFLATIITTPFSGSLVNGPEQIPNPPLPSVALGYLSYIPQYYLQTVLLYLAHAVQHPRILPQGLIFSASLLLILFSHEMGHYLACRRYGVSA